MFSTQMSFIPKSGEGWAVSKEVGLGEVTSKEKVVGIKRAFGFKKKKKSLPNILPTQKCLLESYRTISLCSS